MIAGILFSNQTIYIIICWFADPIDFKLTLSFFLFSGQMFLMDRFFDGAFLTFGLEVIAFAEQDQEDRLDPLIYVFPRMTKCTFHKFGTSGEVEKHDALCLLPLNIVNEVCLFVCSILTTNPINFDSPPPQL